MKTAFKKVFVAIDFSPASDEALSEAHERAQSGGAQLAVCHVVPNELGSAFQFPMEMKSIGEAASARVAEITGRTQGQYELFLEDGTPHAAILNRAEEWLADLIVAGSRGSVGTVADSIVRHAHCPVLVVRGVGPTAVIVVGTDFSDPSLPAIRAGADEAERTGARLVVVHSLDLVWSVIAYPAMAFGGAPFNVSAEEVAKLSTAATERLEAALQKMNVKAEAVITTGAAGTAILGVAAERKADLVVVGTVGRTGLRRALLGSVAATVVEQATCRVLVVRQHPE